MKVNNTCIFREKLRASVNPLETFVSRCGLRFQQRKSVWKRVDLKRVHSIEANYKIPCHLKAFLDVSKNRATRKWMVYNGKPLLKWMIWGVPLFSETSIYNI